jgi:hypothetical protein
VLFKAIEKKVSVFFFAEKYDYLGAAEAIWIRRKKYSEQNGVLYFSVPLHISYSNILLYK